MLIKDFYVFFPFDKIVSFFPGIDFNLFSDYEKLSILLTFNIFYALFLFFIIFCIIKFAYFTKNFLSQFM